MKHNQPTQHRPDYKSQTRVKICIKCDETLIDESCNKTVAKKSTRPGGLLKFEQKNKIIFQYK